jgi:bacillopeptidase F
VLVGLFGLKALIGFSLFVGRSQGNTPTPTPTKSVILPPTLDPPPEATNTATIIMTGKGQPNLSLLIYINNSEFTSLSVPQNGVFTIPNVPLASGTNTISAKLTDGKGSTSDPSNIVSVIYINTPPKLVVSAPDDNATISGDPGTVTVSGMTDDNVSVTINGHMVVVNSDDSFSYAYPLNSGDNALTIVATDNAGNQTTVTKKVTYNH